MTDPESGTLCSPTLAGQDEYLYWDMAHPTAAGHRVIADIAYGTLTAIPELSTWAMIAMTISWRSVAGAVQTAKPSVLGLTSLTPLSGRRARAARLQRPLEQAAQRLHEMARGVWMAGSLVAPGDDVAALPRQEPRGPMRLLDLPENGLTLAPRGDGEEGAGLRSSI
jgi:hypothetical protein